MTLDPLESDVVTQLSAPNVTADTAEGRDVTGGELGESPSPLGPDAPRASNRIQNQIENEWKIINLPIMKEKKKKKKAKKKMKQNNKNKNKKINKYEIKKEKKDGLG